MANYQRPPITEAVIEARLASPIDDKLFEKLRKSSQKRYENISEEVEIEFRFDAIGSNAAQTVGVSGIRMDRNDAVDILIIKKDILAVCRLAPYCGWEELANRADDEWDRWAKIIGDRPFERLGIRFINRIDVPTKGDGKFDIGSFVKFEPTRPPSLVGTARGFSCTVAGVAIDDYLVNVTATLVPSPLIDHAGILLDIDIGAEKLASFTDLKGKREQARAIKNTIFEELITDASRQLFNAS